MQLVQLLRFLGHVVIPRVALALAACIALPSSAQAGTLDDVLQALQSVPRRHATFEETKRFALVNGPLVRRGTLEYERPDRLQMRVDVPYRERLEIRGSTVTLERRGSVSHVDLSAQPALAAWIESLRATLAGDRAALERHFDVQVEGTRGDWRLTLVPRDVTLASVVSRVTIAGRDAEVLRFEVDETRGDSSVTVITSSPTP
jgi:outer membrane lipoprotein-sorting protein